MKLICMSNNHMYKTSTGLSLRAGGQGFPPAIMNVAPGLIKLHWKIEEK